METDQLSAESNSSQVSNETSSEHAMGRSRRIRRRIVSTSFTMIVLAGTVASIMFTVNLIATRAAAVPELERAQPISIATDVIALQSSYQITRRFVGQIEAGQSTQIGFEGAGTLSQMMFEEGDNVAAGAVLATLDRRLLEADVTRLMAAREAVKAQAELARRTNVRQKELNARGFASNQALDQSSLLGIELSARISELDAAILAAKIRLEKTEIVAPFDGVITQRFLDKGTIVSAGQPIYGLLETEAPVFRVGIDPDLATSVQMGSEVQVETAQQFVVGRAVSLSANVDPVTRSRILRVELPRTPAVVFGDTGTVSLKQNIAQSGAWLPLSALKDGVRGLWDILTVQPVDGGKNIVGLEAVEIIYSDARKAFVTGTFDEGTTFITEGTHRVVPGQIVRIGQ